MLRALRKIFLEILSLGTIVFPLILVWSWIEHVSVATYVLASLAFSAAIVTLLIVVIRNTTHSVFPTPKGLSR